MNTRARHPEVLALALIVLLLGTGAQPFCVSLDWDAFEPALREQVAEIETRIAEGLETLTAPRWWPH